jgi:rhodanese-related sulfurtransferase
MNPPTIKTIRCEDLHAASLRGAIELIDVRTPEEFSEVRAAMARNIPLDTFDPLAVLAARQSSPDAPLYFICAVGGRSAWACEVMMAAGANNVVNVEGGTQAWLSAGLPVKQGG